MLLGEARFPVTLSRGVMSGVPINVVGMVMLEPVLASWILNAGDTGKPPKMVT